MNLTFEIFKINIIFTSLSIKIHCIVIDLCIVLKVFEIKHSF